MLICLDEEVISEIQELIPRMQAQNMLRGVGGDLMKEACCFLVMKCSLGKFPVNDDIIGKYSFSRKIFFENFNFIFSPSLKSYFSFLETVDRGLLTL